MKSFVQTVLTIFLFVLSILPNQAFCELLVTPYGFSVSIEPGEELIQQVILVNSGENDIDFFILQFGAQWLQVDPQNGEIAADDEIMIEFIFNAPRDEGVFLDRIEIDIEEIGVEDEIEQFEFSVVMVNDLETANLSGIVRDAANNELLENTIIQIDQFQMMRFSSGEGEYSFLNLPLREYEITCSAPGYHQFSEAVELNQNGDFQFDIDMLHSECNPNVANIETELMIDEVEDINFEVANDGNAPLTYSVSLVPRGDEDEARWNLIRQIPVGEILDDSRIQGAVYVNDRFYLAGSNNRDPQIYILNRDGELLDQFDQFGGGGAYGHKDLAYDGELIWGSGIANIWAFTTERELVEAFQGPFNPNNNFAWDQDRNLLWVSSTTSDIAGLDENANVVAQLDRQGMRIYGLSYFPEDPDGFPLYIFHKDRNVADQIVSKMNPDTGELMFVCILQPEGEGTPASSFITNQYQIGMATFIAISNSGVNDRIDIWHITSTIPWVELNPMEGIIGALNVQEFTLTLDGTDMLEDEYEFDILFIHDGFDGETRIPVLVNVVQMPDPIGRDIQMAAGWNMVSINLDLVDRDIINITQPLVENEQLIIMKDYLGRFYLPVFGFNQIPEWNVTEGYQINVTEDCQLQMEGQPIEFDRPIRLREGWQMVSYFPEQEVDARVALANIVEELILAKDGLGRFYNPEFQFSNMGDMIPTQGYQLNMDMETELVYNLDEDLAGNYPGNRKYYESEVFPVHKPTSENMSLLVNCEDTFTGEIGVYIKDNLVGSGVIRNGMCGIAVWGDDPTTEEIDGALHDEKFDLVFADANGTKEADFEIIDGNGLYQINDFQTIMLVKISEILTKFEIISAFPNPFNSNTSINYNLQESGNITLVLFDLNGRKIMTVSSGRISAGSHTLTIDGSSLSSGVYIAEMKMGGKVSKEKLTLVK